MLADDGASSKIIFLTRLPVSIFQFVCIDRVGSFEIIRWLLHVNLIVLDTYDSGGKIAIIFQLREIAIVLVLERRIVHLIGIPCWCLFQKPP